MIELRHIGKSADDLRFFILMDGNHADGVTVHVPLSQLPRVRPEGFDWMVPGMRAELLTATIRALPKPVRVQLVPAPDVARAVDACCDHRDAGCCREWSSRRLAFRR